ncbi:MAG TPA: ParB/RepB/Spo0J family partition protein [Candidatus Bathyarchaeia archaeon]|nr:ParB/RepB/Spo0J family partition protein [Candidatus Bathyarchaeia archaeon]
MEKRLVLGKGLSALISSQPEQEETGRSENGAQFIETEKISYNAQQPRLFFSQDALEELKASIREKGILQPILVRPKGEGYEVVAGERRLRAAQALKMAKVPVVVREVSDEESLVLALIENIQRQELNAIEEGKAFQRLVDGFGLTQEQIADAVGKDRSTVSNLMRLLKLPQAIQDAVVQQMITMGHARTLLSIDDPQKQYQVFLEIMERGVSVRQAEELSRGSVSDEKKEKREKKHKDHELVHLEEELRGILGTKVAIQAKKKRGKIVIEYYSLDDLDRILDLLRAV